MECEVDDCSAQRYRERRHCGPHRKWLERHGTLDGFVQRVPRVKPHGGEWHLEKGYLVRYEGRKAIWQHREVMEGLLGRPLLPEENVHHLNGDRADNAPANLELWSTSQPYGQRVEDKVRWAREILALYESGAPAG